MARTTATREFLKQRDALNRAGARKQFEKIATAWMDSQTTGVITLKATDYGESRAAVEKWEIGSRYRLITQVVSQDPMHRIFLFAGSHADVDRWLDKDAKRKWVSRPSDQTISRIVVSERVEAPQVSLSKDFSERELLFGLSDESWKLLNLSREGEATARKISSADIEVGDLDSIVLDCSATTEQACCLLDIATLAYEGKAGEIPARIDLLAGEAVEVEESELSSALSAIKSTDELITFDDPEELRQLLNRDNWEDWQLFLHPKQRALVDRVYSGPARIRGVSGSGKTCVAVHRARHLSEKYRQPVLLVTLTRSARNLLQKLKDALCGVGSLSARRIRTATMFGVTAAFLREFDYPWIRQRHDRDDRIRIADTGDVVRHVERALAFSECRGPLQAEPTLSTLVNKDLLSYVIDEVAYVRTTFRVDGRDEYLSAKRAGRGIALSRNARVAILAVTKATEDGLDKAKTIDQEGLVLRALFAVTQRIEWDGLQAIGDFPFPLSRCVIVDEAQDMTENELRLLSMFVPQCDDSLFVVGDGAQKIFNRGFTFSRAGIDVRGRSTIFRKNYRNTRQILKAAYPLVTSFVNETAEDNSKYLEGNPDYSARDGVPPECAYFSLPADEIRWVAEKAKWYVENHGLRPSDVCIISPSSYVRTEVQSQLVELGLDSVELKAADPSVHPELVRISTIESAKGHEFPVVFVPGLVEGFLPSRFSQRTNSLWLGAARLYVAMTRARDWLHLSCSLHYGREVMKPSRYLEVLSDNCTVVDHRPSRESSGG